MHMRSCAISRARDCFCIRLYCLTVLLQDFCNSLEALDRGLHYLESVGQETLRLAQQACLTMQCTC